MFTGLVEATGSVVSADFLAGGDLVLRAERVSRDAIVGESIAVNGCCLTVAEIKHDLLRFNVLAETLRRTNLRRLREGQLVNLERALSAGGRFGGHLVQGHIDCAVTIRGFEKIGADYRLEMELPPEFARYVVAKGSIAIDGISLTVAEVGADYFLAWIIPHTRAVTNLQSANPGDLVNLECDLIAKYVERIPGSRSG